MRRLAIFKDRQGDPVAINAECIVSVERDYDIDADGNETANECFCITTDEYHENNEYTVQGPFSKIIKEIELCIQELEDWQCD